jgi:hypothetical protein
MGPVPRDLFEELSGDMQPDMKTAIHDLPEEGFQKIRPKKQFENRYFSKKEMKLLEEISFIFNEAKADEMVESTHLTNEPWDRTLKLRVRAKINSQFQEFRRPTGKARKRRHIRHTPSFRNAAGWDAWVPEM